VKRRHLRTLAAATMFGASAVYFALWAAAGDQVDTVSAGRVEALPDLAIRPTPELAALQATRARPVFTPSRRPIEAKQPGSAETPLQATETPPPVTRLIAVATGPQRKVAIVQLTTGGTSVVMEGEEINGWTLTRIEPGQVCLKAGKREAIFSLPNRRGST
jgi:general secretion pathway protein N